MDPQTQVVLMYLRQTCPRCAEQMAEVNAARLTPAQRLRLLCVEIGTFKVSTDQLQRNGVTGVPTSLLLGPDNTVLQTYSGVMDRFTLARWLGTEATEATQATEPGFTPEMPEEEPGFVHSEPM